MTAILQQLRQLEKRRRRGDINAVEYARLRATIKSSVEEADAVIEGEVIDGEVIDGEVIGGTGSEPAPGRYRPAGPGSLNWGLGLVICLGVIGLSMGLALMLFVDVSFGMTLGVTLLAALTVALFRGLEEEE